MGRSAEIGWDSIEERCSLISEWYSAFHVMATHPLLIGDLFRRNADVVPDRAAASLGDRVVCHGELNAAGNRIAWALAGLGIGQHIEASASSGPPNTMRTPRSKPSASKMPASIPNLTVRASLPDGTPYSSFLNPTIVGQLPYRIYETSV